MAGFDLRGMLTAVETMVSALPSIVSTSAAVTMGVPLTFDALINAFIFLGPATPGDNAFGGQDWEPMVTVVFGYRVQGGEQTAELIIADLILQITNQVLVTDPTVGGTIDDGRVKLDMNAAARPEYAAIAGSEARMYPVTIRGFQQRYV